MRFFARVNPAARAPRNNHGLSDDTVSMMSAGEGPVVPRNNQVPPEAVQGGVVSLFRRSSGRNIWA